jgi:hypothetical protein
MSRGRTLHYIHILSPTPTTILLHFPLGLHGHPRMSSPIEHLPNELLVACFSHLCSSTPTIQALRLTSRRFHDASSLFLIPDPMVHFTTQSLDALAQIADHPIISKGVKSVIINVCYYDIRRAKNSTRFTRSSCRLISHFLSCSRELEGRSDLAWSPTDDLSSISPAFRRGQEIWQEWSGYADQMHHSDSTLEALGDRPLPSDLNLLVSMYSDFRRLCEDQQAVMKGTGGVAKLVGALAKLPALTKILITDNITHFDDGYEKTPAADIVSDEGLRRCCLSPIQWRCIHPYPTRSAQPPIFILATLFNALTASPVRVAHFAVHLTAPGDMEPFSMSTSECSAILQVVSRAETVSFRMWHWERSINYDAVPRLRSPEETAALLTFTRALFASPALKRLELHLDRNPDHGTRWIMMDNKVVSAAMARQAGFTGRFQDPHQAFPVSLRAISLTSLKITLAEIGMLTDSLSDFLTSLSMCNVRLAGGEWRDALYHLKKLKKLQHVDLRPHLVGGGAHSVGILGQTLRQATAFLLGEMDSNPIVRRTTSWE